MLSDYCHVEDGVYLPWCGGIVITNVTAEETPAPGRTQHSWIVRVDVFAEEPTVTAIVDLSARFYRMYYEKASMVGVLSFPGVPHQGTPLPRRGRFPDAIWATMDDIEDSPDGLEWLPADPITNSDRWRRFWDDEGPALSEVTRLATLGCERRGLRKVGKLWLPHARILLAS